jgi:membrane-associated phospholipid phosphatase
LPLIRFESRLGQPSLNWARKGNKLFSELLHIFYFSYYLYTLVIGIFLDMNNRLLEFEVMSLAVTTGYLVSYVTFALVPVYGPRWALVEEGLLSPAEQRAKGYWITSFTNKLMYGGPALKGGAMPSSHTSTAVIFLYWCWVLWGPVAGLGAALVVIGMCLGAIYGRYHYIVDVVIGALLGVISIILAEWLI